LQHVKIGAQSINLIVSIANALWQKTESARRHPVSVPATSLLGKLQSPTNVILFEQWADELASSISTPKRGEEEKDIMHMAHKRDPKSRNIADRLSHPRELADPSTPEDFTFRPFISAKSRNISGPSRCPRANRRWG